MSIQIKTLETLPNKIFPLKAEKGADQVMDLESGLTKNYVKLLTYNLFLRPVVKNNESDYKYERLEEFVKVIDDFDIIWNQEAFIGMNSFKPRLLVAAKKAGFKYKALPSRPSFLKPFCIDSGLLILSRFPIVETDEIIYKKYFRDDSISSKGVLYAKIEIGGQHLHVFNTHLQANYYNNFFIYKQGINTRMYQLKQLSEYVLKKTEGMSPDDLVLITGDFNISSRAHSNVLKEQFKILTQIDAGFESFTDPNFDSTYEYQTMLKILSDGEKHDVFDFKNTFSDSEGGPPTFGAVVFDEEDNPLPVETALSNEMDLMSQQSIDYILQFWPVTEPNNIIEEDKHDLEASGGSMNQTKQRLSEKLVVDRNSLKIEEFLISGKPFNTLSDHFGVSLHINVNS